MHSLPPTDTPNTRRSINFRSGGSDVCPTCGGTGKVAKGIRHHFIYSITIYNIIRSARRVSSLNTI